MPITKYLLMLSLGMGLAIGRVARAADTVSAGPLFERFNLTLAPGQRTEVVSPFFYTEQKEEQHTWAIPPLTLSYAKDPSVDTEEFDFAYPIISYARFGSEYRFQIFQVFAFAGGNDQKGDTARRFTLFPIYFQQRSKDPNLNYTAILPLFGTLKNRLFRDRIDFVLFPLYSKTKKSDVITHNMPWPVFSISRGDGLYAWQFWPLTGHDHKVVTTRTNGFNEVETVPGHDSRFVMWPFFFNSDLDIGTDHPAWEQTFIPFYTLYRSKLRNSTTYFWPLGLTHTVDDEKHFHQWAAPWPLIVFDRGSGKYTSRVWPFYSHSTNQSLTSDWIMWPVYKYSRVLAPPLYHERTRSLFFFYSDLKETNQETGASMRRMDLWPVFTHHRDFNGDERLQILSVIEPVLPDNHKVERIYSHVYALCRAERNGKTGANSQSLLWNLYRHDEWPEGKKTSLLFGLFQYQSTPAGRRWRVCYIPFGRAQGPPPGHRSDVKS